MKLRLCSLLLILLLVACGGGGGTDQDEVAPPSTLEEQDIKNDVGDRRQLEDHSITLMDYQTFPADEPIGDNSELLAVEFYIENTGQGDISFAILQPFVLLLPGDVPAWESPDCESRVSITRPFFLSPESSATYNQCWLVPLASEAAVIVISYDYNKELVEGDSVQWEIRR